MPPKSVLSSEEIAKLEKWITMGAPDPRPKVESDVALVEEFDLEKRYNEHWCWREVESHQPPQVKQKDWPKQAIDQFVLKRIEDAGLVPSTEADQRTWLRRVYFDLIGLPPTPQQIAEFLDHGSKQKVVDQLLASPHFGEKWARHWMDLVRYAETCGHEFDYPIPHARQYRDYLIRMLNEDLPYDDIIREHVAGDLLKNPRLKPDTQTNESILATGFWYFHDATHAPTDVRADEADHLDNQIDVFGKTFQALTISCARCNDHKFGAGSTAGEDALAVLGISSGHLVPGARSIEVLEQKQVAALLARRDPAREGHRTPDQRCREAIDEAHDSFLMLRDWIGVECAVVHTRHAQRQTRREFLVEVDLALVGTEQFPHAAILWNRGRELGDQGSRQVGPIAVELEKQACQHTHESVADAAHLGPNLAAR